ncbi:hypothetical protein PG996_011761 [Apiospora saccharicola]|uniref:Uncharacterized protein n=1 Tax=Apiospora saccharicola TaxID=335842 RepID=A0ABR1UG12_9PEZI
METTGTTPPAAITDSHSDNDMVAQYFADTIATEQDGFDDSHNPKNLRTYAVEALKYLKVGDILQLRRQATAALHYMENINT